MMAARIMQFANMIIKLLKAAKICSKPSRTHAKVVGPMMELFIDTMNIKENICA